MDPSSASTANENEKKRGCSEEAEDVQDDSKRICPISILLPTGDEAGFGSIDEDSNNNVELNDHFLTERWPNIKPLFRDLAYKYLEKKLPPEVHSFLLSLSKQRENSGSSSRTLQFKLVFRNQIAPRMYANDEIRSESGEPLEIALCDPNNNNAIIVSTDRFSSAPLKFFLLDADFKEITNSRKGKPSSLISDNYPQIYLQNGVALASGLFVTDNSSWTISKEFCLGVKIIDEEILDEFGIIEQAISKPFKVLDDRMRGSEKRHPPNWDDEIWRLEGIREDGTYHKILSSLQPPINTVGEFLDTYSRVGPNAMRKILNLTKAVRKWNKIFNHAMEYFDPTVDLQVNNVDLVQNQTANDELIGNEGQGNLKNDHLVGVYQQNNTLQANNDQVEANCNENSEVCEQKTNGDNQLQTTSSFDELINVDVTGEIEAAAPHDHRGYYNTPLSPTGIL